MKDVFNGFGMLIHDVRVFSPAECYELSQKGVVFVDLRERDFCDYKALDIPGVVYFPASEFPNHIHQLNPDQYYILMDSSGLHSREQVIFLQQQGFAHVGHMAGGFVEWERDGLPVRIDVNERLSGSCACQLKPRERKK